MGTEGAVFSGVRLSPGLALTGGVGSLVEVGTAL